MEAELILTQKLPVGCSIAVGDKVLGECKDAEVRCYVPPEIECVDAPSFRTSAPPLYTLVIDGKGALVTRGYRAEKLENGMYQFTFPLDLCEYIPDWLKDAAPSDHA